MTETRLGGGRTVDPRPTTQHPRGASRVRKPARACSTEGAGACETLESRTLLTTWYVSTAGSDAFDGRSIPGAFRTIQQAANEAQPGDTVLVRGGTYRETVTPPRSGTSSARITYKAYEGERVTVSGTERVSGWSKHSGSVYQADQDWDLGFGKNQVFVDGKMMIEARWPNTTLDVSRPKKATADDVDTSGGYATLKDSELTQSSGYWDGAIISIAPGQSWVTQTGKVTSSSPGKIGFTYRSMGRHAGPEGGDPYYLTGKFKALDAPTEWFRDGDGSLYLWTEKSDDPAGHSVEAKRRDYAFDLNNREYLTIEGFDLFAATIVSNPNSGHLRLTGLNAWYLSHFTTMSDGWEQDHDTGLYIDGDDNVLSDSTIAYRAGHGVLLAGEDNRVENCLIRDVDYNGGDAAAVRTIGSGHVITRNTVYNTGRSGIKISNATDLKITHNVIRDAMLQTTDGGGVYTFGIDGRGTEIAYNRISGIKTGGYGGTGVFLDNNSSNYVVHHNVIWNVNHALKLNYTSRGHRIYNNTLAGNDYSVGTSSNSRMPGTSFKNNIFTNEVKIAGDASESHNLYHDTDAKFSNSSGADFSLRSSSPAIDEGVKASPYTDGYSGGAAPDVGALEYGKGAFSAGANLSVKTPPGQPPAVRPPATPGGGNTGGTGGTGGSTPGAGTGTPGTGTGTPGTGTGTPGTGTGASGGTGNKPGSTPPRGNGSTPPPAEHPPISGPIVVAPAEGISVAEVVPVRMPQHILAGEGTGARRRAARGRVKVVLKNEGTAAAAGPVTLTLLASSDAAPTPDADLYLGRLKRSVRLKPGETREVMVRVKVPAAAAGDYLLLASAAGPSVSFKNLAQGAAPVRVELAAVQLAPATPTDGAAAAPIVIRFGRRNVITVPVINLGNIPATDPVDLELRVSTDGTLVNSLPVATVTGLRPGIAAGATRPVKVAFDLPAIPPGLVAGNYVLLVKLATADAVLASIPFSIA